MKINDFYKGNKKPWLVLTAAFKQELFLADWYLPGIIIFTPTIILNKIAQISYLDPSYSYSKLLYYFLSSSVSFIFIKAFSDFLN